EKNNLSFNLSQDQLNASKSLQDLTNTIRLKEIELKRIENDLNAKITSHENFLNESRLQIENMNRDKTIKTQELLQLGSNLTEVNDQLRKAKLDLDSATNDKGRIQNDINRMTPEVTRLEL